MAQPLPLGHLTKPEVREIARGLGLVTADKPESQEICFVPGGDYRAELGTRGGWSPESGPVLDVDGSRLGEHDGTAGYTVGQRKGLGVAVGEPRYVSRIDAATNAIVLGRREDLETSTIPLEAVTFVADTPPAGRGPGGDWLPFRAAVRIRHRAPLVEAWVRPVSVAEPARNGAWTRRDRHAGLGHRTGTGLRALRRRRVPRRRPDRSARSAHGTARGCAADRRDARVTIGPALPLAILVGFVCTAVYVLVRGDAGGRLPLTFLAAVLGAWAGAAIGGRLGITFLAIGDFALVPAVIVSGVAIGIVAILATLGPQSRKAG